MTTFGEWALWGLTVAWAGGLVWLVLRSRQQRRLRRMANECWHRSAVLREVGPEPQLTLTCQQCGKILDENPAARLSRLKARAGR